MREAQTPERLPAAPVATDSASKPIRTRSPETPRPPFARHDQTTLRRAHRHRLQRGHRTDRHKYAFTPTAFANGELSNAAGENNGSCKLFSFAKLTGLTKEQTLACFGHHYTDHVLKHPEGTDHANIRNFMKHGWDGIRFEGEALKVR